MRFFFITNSPTLARFVGANGVERIFVDLELMGKVKRQGHLNTIISRHSMSDVARVRAAVPDMELMVRLNPVHDASPLEIDAAIAAGADVIMLPMFRQIAEVASFVTMIRKRCRLCLLVETRDAMELIGDLAMMDGVDELHIGLNDLSLDMKLDFMFEPFALGLVDRMAAAIAPSGKPFGIGGLARADEGLLPARLLLGEHVRVGSSASILSRTFHRQLESVQAIEREMNFADEVDALRKIELDFRRASPDALETNRIGTWNRITEIGAQRARSSG